jgi:hypothetical protein
MGTKMDQALVCSSSQCGAEALTQCPFCGGIPFCGECFIAHNVLIHKDTNVGVIMAIGEGIMTPVLKIKGKPRRSLKVEANYIKRVFTS